MTFLKIKEICPGLTDGELKVILNFIRYVSKDKNIKAIFGYAEFMGIRLSYINPIQLKQLEKIRIKKPKAKKIQIPRQIVHEIEQETIQETQPIKRIEEKRIEPNKNECVINKYLKLRLEKKQTHIYVNDRLFTQCMYLLLNISLNEREHLDNIDSIDEAAEKLSRKMEHRHNIVAPEVEFMGHCSNIQTWAENEYDTRILHRNIAFPLLKRLTDVGDPIAKKRFKEEIAKRFNSGYRPVMTFLVNEGYLNYLDNVELDVLRVSDQDKDFEKQIENIISKRKNEVNLLKAAEWDQLAEAHFVNNEILEAIKARKMALELNPNLNQGLDNLAKLYASLEPNSFKAIQKEITDERLRNLIKVKCLEKETIPLIEALIDDNFAASEWARLADIYFKTGQKEKTINSMKIALEIDYLLPQGVEKLATFYISLEPEDFEIKLRTITAQDLKSTIKDICFRNKLVNLIERLPDEDLSALDWKKLASMYLQSRKYEKGLNSMKTVLKLDPEFPDGLKILAYYYLINKDYNNAIGTYLLVLKKYPDDVQILKNLTIYTLKIGYKNVSFKFWKLLIQLYSSDIYFRELLFDLIRAGCRKARIYFRMVIDKAISSNNMHEIDILVCRENLDFVTLKQLEDIFSRIDVENSDILEKINSLINIKYVIDNLKKQKSINIDLETRYKDLKRLY